MSVNKALIALILLLALIVGIELIVLSRIPQPKSVKSTTAQKTITPTQTIPTPTLTTSLSNDQSYRTSNAPDRLTRFINTALISFLTELSDYAPTKSVNIRVDSQYEGKIEGIYQGKEAEKIRPPDPKFPKRTVVAIIDINDSSESVSSKKTISIYIVGSELPYLNVRDERGKKIELKSVKGKKARINRIIELPVKKNADVVTLEPIVYTNVIILDK